jgi:hypothetical protein
MSGKCVVLKLKKGVTPPFGYILKKELRNINVYQKCLINQQDVDELMSLMQTTRLQDPNVEMAVVNTDGIDSVLDAFGEMKIGGFMKKTNKSRRHKSRRHKSKKNKSRRNKTRRH